MLLIRADASASMGVGHAMRCLALAEEWLLTETNDGVTFAMREVPDALTIKIENSGAKIERLEDDRAETIAMLAARLRARFVVVDGYHLDKAIQPALAAKGERTVLVIDDEGESATDAATIVLNQNPYARKELYTTSAPHAHLLLGPSYALLRREFRDRVHVQQRPPQSRLRVLVSFGGADALNLTTLIMDALVGFEDVDQEFIVGAANPRAKELKARAKRPDDVFVSVDDMATRMERADLAIVAAGSTCWELACIGVPMLVVATADNQRSVQKAIVAHGIGAALGGESTSKLTIDNVRETVERLLGNDGLRQEMSRRGRELVDGHGTTRVVDVLTRRDRGVERGWSS